MDPEPFRELTDEEGMSDLLRDWCGLCSRVYLQRLEPVRGNAAERLIGPECQPALEKVLFYNLSRL